MRVLKRRFESGSIARGPLFAAAPAPARPRRTTALAAVGALVRGGWTLDEPRSLPFLWEAVAFALGLGVSLLLS